MSNKPINVESRKSIDKKILNAITIDCVVFGFDKGNLEVLLIKRADGIQKGKWALPGDWILEDEHIDEAANRLLEGYTNLKDVFLEQLKAFGNPARFPLGRVITIGYYALLKKENLYTQPGYRASEILWCNVNEIPELIYDHNEIIEFAQQKLQEKVRKEPIGFNLLPEKFTLLELMQLYEEILHYKMDKPNFRKKILKMKLLNPLDEKQTNVSHRAAQLYEFNQDNYEKLTKKGFTFEF